MNDDNFNMQIRKFLKTVGVTSQREIEKAVREALEAGRLGGDEQLAVSMRLSLPGVDLAIDIDGVIALE